MISLKLASIIAIAAFAAGSLFAPPVQQAIAAVIATDVQCTGCVGTADVAGNAITAAKIKDGEIKAADIATDAVGSSEIMPNSVGAVELQGVSKLIYVDCHLTDNTFRDTNEGMTQHCSAPGVASGDRAIITNNGNFCYVMGAITSTDSVAVRYTNICSSQSRLLDADVAIIVFKT